MDLKALFFNNRDASKVHAALKELEDGQLVALKDCKIYVPERYTEKSLAFLGQEVYILGIFGIVVEGQWAGVSSAAAIMRIEPTSTDRVDVDGERYMEFFFEKGSTVVANVNLVKTDTLVYLIFDEFHSKGNVPFYMNLEDVANVYKSASYHAGMGICDNHVIMEMFTASIARNAKDMGKLARQSLTSRLEIFKNPPVYVPFRSVTFGASNTLSKLMGNYFDEGLNSALRNPSTRSERIEQMLLT